MKLRTVTVTGRPIVAWPGEQTMHRQRAKFKARWSATLDLLDRELHQLDAKNIVLQLALRERDFRSDGYPRADARPQHPGVILSLDSPYGPLSYPCDQFDYWQDNVRAIALALEALRKVDRYGVTKRGEQYTGWRQLPSGTPMPAPMTLDEAAYFLAQHGTPSLIDEGGWRNLASPRYAAAREATYRAAARKLHPDTGGTTELFQRLQEAKRLLDTGDAS